MTLTKLRDLLLARKLPAEFKNQGGYIEYEVNNLTLRIHAGPGDDFYTQVFETEGDAFPDTYRHSDGYQAVGWTVETILRLKKW